MRKLIIIAATLFLMSCGSGEKQEGTTAKATSNATIALSTGDEMKFDKTMLMVEEGQEVTLTLTHTGEMPKEVMGHNWVLLKEGTDISAFADLAVSATETDYIPESDAIIAYTKTIGGGESTTVTFIAPSKGSYEYICSFPGHYSMMKGKLMVR